MRITVILFLLSLQLGLRAGGIEFFQGSWEEAKAAAAATDKLIFVDAYASWCGPCKHMSATVFTDEAVGQFFNRHFINLKLDMEQEESADFRQYYSVSAFPTLFFLNDRGEAIQQIRGALDAQRFLAAARTALAHSEPLEELQEAYESGERDPAAVYRYVRALIRAGESHLRVANEYVRSQQDLSTEQNLRFLLLAATEADSRLFDLMTRHAAAISQLVGTEAYTEQVVLAGEATVAKALEYKSIDLLATAISKVEAHAPARAAGFSAQARMRYAQASGDAKEYLKALKDYADKVLDSAQPEGLDEAAIKASEAFPNDDKVMAIAAELAARAAATDTHYKYYYTHAGILKQMGKADAARTAALRALDLARAQSPTSVRMIEYFIQQL